MSDNDAIPIRLPGTSTSKHGSPSASGSTYQQRPRPQQRNSHNAVTSGEGPARNGPLYAMSKKQKKLYRQEQNAWGSQKKKGSNSTQSQAAVPPSPGGHASQSSNEKPKSHPNSNQQKNQGQHSQPNQPKKPAHAGQNTKKARAPSQGPSTPGAKKARLSGSASPSPAPISAPAVKIPTPIRNQQSQPQTVSSPSMQGLKTRFVDANVEVQDEAGNIIDLGRPGEIADKLATLVAMIRKSMSLPATTHIRMVHIRPGNRLVPIFDAFDWTYFLERLSVDPTAKQILQAQFYSAAPAPASASAPVPGVALVEKKRKREESVDSEEASEAMIGDSGIKQSPDIESGRPKKGKHKRRKSTSRNGSRSPSIGITEIVAAPTHGTAPAPKVIPELPPAAPVPSPSAPSGSKTQAPDSPSPAPRLLANIGHQFKPHRPSPLSRPVVLPPPSVSSATSSSRESSPDGDVSMEDLSAARDTSSKAPGLHDVVKAVAGLSALLPLVSATLTSTASSSSSTSAEADSPDADIGNDTVLDESGITQAEAAKALEEWNARKASQDAKTAAPPPIQAKKAKALEKEKLKEELRLKKAQEKEEKRLKKEKAAADKLAAREAKAAARKLAKEPTDASRKAIEEATKRLAEAEALRRKETEAEEEKMKQEQREQKLEQERKANEERNKQAQAVESKKRAVATIQPLQGGQGKVAQSSSHPTEPIKQPAPSSKVPQSDSETESDSDTESESESEGEVVATKPKTTASATQSQGATPVIPAATAPNTEQESVIVAPATQVEESTSESSSESESSSSEESTDDEAAADTSVPANAAGSTAVPSTAVRIARLPSSSPEPYSDDEDELEEAPRKQSQRRRSQRSPSTDALIPEGDDDDDDASSIDVTQPLIRLSQIQPSLEEIESGDEEDAAMDVDVVEDFPAPIAASTEDIISSAEAPRKVRPAVDEDPDATDDEDQGQAREDDQQGDDEMENVGEQDVEREGDETVESPPSPAATARSPLEIAQAMDVTDDEESPVQAPDAAPMSDRSARRSFAELADEVEASASAAPSTGNQVFFQALQTEADGDQAALQSVISEQEKSAQRKQQSDADQLVPDESAEAEESQSSSIPDSTPTPAPSKRRIMPSRTSKSASSPRSETPPTLTSGNTPPANNGSITINSATSETRSDPSQETSAASESSSSQPKQIAPLPKKRGRPPKIRPPPETADVAPSEPASTETTESLQTAMSQNIIGSSVSPRALLTRELEEAPSSPAAPPRSPGKEAALAAARLSHDPREEARIRKRVGSKPCIICDASPSHLSKDCPVVVKGLASIEGRIAELQAAGGNQVAVEQLKGWQNRLSKSAQNRAQSTASTSDTSVQTSTSTAAVGTAPGASPAPVSARLNRVNGTASPGLNGLSVRKRATIGTRNNIPTLSSLKADALRKPRLSANSNKEPASTPTVEKPSPFGKRGADSDDEESSSGSSTDSDDGSKGPALPPSLAGRMANGIKSAKKAVGW